MSKKLFTEQEIEILKHNKYVKRVGPKGITYTDEMKQFTMKEMEKGFYERAFLREFYIMPAFRKRGFSRVLYDATLNLIKYC